MTLAAVLFDFGDVIMQEETEVKDEECNTLRAQLVEGMGDVLCSLKKRGMKIGLVADTRPKTAQNVLRQHQLYDLFDAITISEQVGCEKPDPRIFVAALESLGIEPCAYKHVMMVGNRLYRDVRGANQLGMISVWFHWNDRYARDYGAGDIPTYEVKTATELLDIIERMDIQAEGPSGAGQHDGSRLPVVEQDEQALAVAARYAPIILADEREPFSVVAAGYTNFNGAGVSPSFPKRRIELTGPEFRSAQAIEYALWWDWDIGHLYELEHVWTYVDEAGGVAAVEASWHGMFGRAEDEQGMPIVDDTHPILFAQPGKHAMAASAEPFDEIREWGETEAGRDAGKDGILENEMFRGKLAKTPTNDARVSAYLKQCAFVPSWKFTRRMSVSTEILLPWRTLGEWIPARVAWLLSQLN